MGTGGGTRTTAEGRRRYLVLAICCLSLLIVGLDNTIVNVALPSIGRELHTQVSGLQWTVDAYVLVLASLLMLSGSTADRIGRRRMFQIGLVLFSLGSLLCSLAPSVGLLVAFRALQAVGGSMLNPVAMSIITNTFTNRRERAQAIGVWGAVVGLSMGLGPVVGGVLVTSVGWRSIFWINVPIGLSACVLTALFVPESKAPRPRRFDPVAQVLLVVGLASATFAIIEGPRRGYASGLILAAFAVSVLTVPALVLYERRRTEPLIDIRFFGSAPFSGATGIAVASFAALGGFLFLNTLYLQDARGLSALQAGLYTLPMAVMTVVLAPVSGAVVGRRGARPPLIAAGAFLAASGVMLTRITPGTSAAWLLIAYALFGIGFGVVNAPITNSAVSGMPDSQAGVAAAVASTSRQVGQVLGVAVLGALATAGLHGAGPSGLAAASHPGWWITAGCGVLVLVLGVATTSRRALASADRVAATFAAETGAGGGPDVGSVVGVERTIAGFHCDEHGDWVAELSCGHNQHVRHKPPFQPRPWVLEEAGRTDRIGQPIECPLCDREEEYAEMGGEAACYAHLVCPECGALIDGPDAHRPGCGTPAAGPLNRSEGRR